MPLPLQDDPENESEVADPSSKGKDNKKRVNYIERRVAIVAEMLTSKVRPESLATHVAVPMPSRSPSMLRRL